jgi:hypothetical protein
MYVCFSVSGDDIVCVCVCRTRYSELRGSHSHCTVEVKVLRASYVKVLRERDGSSGRALSESSDFRDVTFQTI